MNFLSGYKTYIVSAISVLTAVLAYLNGTQKFSTAITDVPGLLLFLGALAASLRHAVAKLHAAVSAPSK